MQKIKFVSIFLIILIILSSLELHVFAATADEAAPVAAATNGTTGDCKWSYDLTTNELKITGSGRMADYQKRTDAPWSEYAVSALSIIIGSGVSYVGDYSFEYFKAASVTIADTVTEVGDYSFAGMYMANTCKMSVNLKTIRDSAFENLGVTGLTIPKSLREIGSRAFYNCDKLRFLTIPNACDCEFDWYNFADCEALETVSIGAKAVIAESCFAYCSALKNFQVSADNPYYTADGGCLYSKDKKELLFYCSGNGATSDELPSHIIELGDYAFSANTTLTNLTLPAGLKKIGSHTFETSELTNLSFRGTALQEIGESAFWGAPYKNKLKDSGLVYVSTVAYTYNGTAPQSITLRSGTKGIADKCFQDQMTLENITLPDNLCHIGAYAFSGCENLNNVTFPSKLESIGDNAFEECKAITRVELPDSVTSLGDKSFYLCRGMKQLRLSQNLTEIPFMAFSTCDALEGNLDIPEKVEKLGSGAFHGCGADSVTVYNRTTELEEGSVRVFSKKLRGYHDSTTEAYAQKYSIRFEPLDKRVTGQLTSFLTGKTTLKLIDTASSDTVAQLTTADTAYTFPDVEEGTYQLVASKKDHVLRTYNNVKVKGNDCVLDVVICPIGDVDGNGKIQAADAMKAYQHAQGKADAQITDDYAFKCADVAPLGAPNGKVQAADAMLIYQQAQGKHSLF